MDRQGLYEEAVRVVERRRQVAETRALRARQGLYEALPRLREIEQQQTAAGAAAATLSAAGQRQRAGEKLEELQSLTAEWETLLAKAGKNPKDLEPEYHCSRCRDTGRYHGKACTCVQEEMKRLRRLDVNASGPLKLCRFENFMLDYYPERVEMEIGVVHPRRSMEGILQECRDWAAAFGPRSKSLYLFGDAGLGKTHLALSIASEVLEAGYDVIYVSSQSAFAAIANFAERERGDELFASMLAADLLILDDLGTEYTTTYILAKLYELVNGRMGRPTIYTTNICRQDMLEMRYDEKIISRLLGESKCLRFWGEDIRLKGK